MMDIPYTICFCIQDGNVLLLHRNHPPNQFKWNGIGGKIEKGEHFRDAVKREIFEEAEIIVRDDQLTYVGIVSWNKVQDKINHNKVMHAFVARLPKGSVPWKEFDTREGLLVWKSIDWVYNTKNKEVVDNIPYFLPIMMDTKKPKEYFCEYKNGRFVKLHLKDLLR